MSNWRWIVWCGLLAAWTGALVVPVPQPDSLPLGEWIWSRKFLVAKTLHVLAYAVLAGSSAWLPMPPRWRWLLPALLLLHGAATEWIQLNLSYRDGSLRDVGFDALGVFLGCAATWKWVRRPHAPREENSGP